MTTIKLVLKKGEIIHCFSCNKPYAKGLRDCYSNEKARASDVEAIPPNVITSHTKADCAHCGGPAIVQWGKNKV